MQPPCAVRVFGETEKFRPLAERFLQSFLSITAKTPRRELLLALLENPGAPLVAQLATAPIPILAVHACYNRVTLGPFQESSTSVCLACYQHWMATVESAKQEASSLPRDLDIELAASLCARVIEAYPTKEPFSDLCNGLVSVETDSNQFTIHPLYRRQDCDICGGESLKQVSQTMRSHCSAVTGIVRKMEITAEPIAGVYIASASYRSPKALGGARPRLRERICTGRGLTSKQAELSCIGEALERYSLVFRGDEPMVRGRIDEVHGIHPNEILRISEAQYDERDEWNRTADDRYLIPERFNTDQAIDWLQAKNLATGEPVFVPAACCLMWYQSKFDEPQFGLADTIGCASWTTFEGASLNAMLELVERDALAIWWYNKLQRPGVSVESFNHPQLIEIQKGLAGLGRTLTLLDVTTDLGIPTYVAVAALLNGTEPLFSSATDFSPQSAATRAASEIMQFWFGAVHHGSLDSEIHAWISAATVEDHSYLEPSMTTDAPPEPPPSTTQESLQACMQRFKSCGLSLLVLDQSRSDVVLKTARAIAPGMRHIWNRKAPGRLYEVPVHMGWRATALAEDELNSICCMI